MSFDELTDNLIQQIDEKINNNTLSRVDLESLFYFILKGSKILYHFDNYKLYEIKSQRINLYLLFVVFIKNYLSEISKYINQLDLTDDYVSEVKKEIISETINIKSKIDTNDIKKNIILKTNEEILKEINRLIIIVENNQKKSEHKKLINKLKESSKLLEDKENEIQSIINEIIDKRNKYLNYTNNLRERYDNDLKIFNSIKNIENTIDSEKNIIEKSLKSIEENISKIIDMNQTAHDELLKNTYPKF